VSVIKVVLAIKYINSFSAYISGVKKIRKKDLCDKNFPPAARFFPGSSCIPAENSTPGFFK